MANLLKMAILQSILSLHAQGWTQRRIARDVGRRSGDGPKVPAATVVRGKTSQRADRLGRVKTASLPTSRLPSQNRPNAPIGCRVRRTARLPRAGQRADRLGCRAGPGQPVRAVPRGDSGASWRTSCRIRRIHQDLTAEGISDPLRQLAAVRPPAGPRRVRCRFAGWNARRARKPKSISARGAPVISPDGKRRKTHVFRIVLQPQPQGIQRGDVHADDRRLSAGLGERLLALRRRAEDAGDRQSQGGGGASRLVRSRAEAQGAILLPALRHGDPADQALHAAAQGQGRSGREVREEQRRSRAARSPAWTQNNAALAALGSDGRRHADSRHDQAAGRQAL